MKYNVLCAIWLGFDFYDVDSTIVITVRINDSWGSERRFWGRWETWPVKDGTVWGKQEQGRTRVASGQRELLHARGRGEAPELSQPQLRVVPQKQTSPDHSGLDLPKLAFHMHYKSIAVWQRTLPNCLFFQGCRTTESPPPRMSLVTMVRRRKGE